MDTAIEQNKELLKSLLLKSRINIEQKANKTEQIISKLDEETKQEDVQKLKIIIDAFNDDIEISEKPSDIHKKKMAEKLRQGLLKHFEKIKGQSILTKNVKKEGDRNLMIQIEKSDTRRGFHYHLGDKVRSPRKGSHASTLEGISPLQPKKIGQYLRKSSNVREAKQ